MHPDATIAGLRRELERLDRNAPDYTERKQAIEGEIKHADGLERPVATIEEPDAVVDRNVPYLAGLKREVERCAEDAKAAVRAEIKRVEALVKGHKDSPAPTPVVNPTEPESEDLSKLSRSDLDELAASEGVVKPGDLPNRDAVVTAILTARAAD